MESHNAEVEVGMGGSGSGANSGPRWNPTKEQICMLEDLYKQGLRTPNAEQIEQITTRLKAYGHIEGKNVFYWFQNHKARQRHRQKQERHAYFNRFLHTSHPTFSSPLCQNVARTTPYCLPRREIGFYSQDPNVLVPAPISPRTDNVVPMMMPPLPISPRPENAVPMMMPRGPIISPRTENVVPMMMPRICNGEPMHDLLQQRIPDYGFSNSNPKTLDLFPQHPTGTLEGKATDQVVSAADGSTHTSYGSPDIDEDGRPANQPFIDFFTSGQGSHVSDFARLAKRN